jgi:DNA modification methylase
LGSGTTLAAAELAKRVCYGLELDPKYEDVIVQRWQFAGQKDGGWYILNRVREPKMGIPA